MNRYSNIAIALIVLSIFAGGAGAVPLEEWNKTFGGRFEDIANSVLQTSDGGYVFAGGTTSYGNGLADVWLVKTDANGNMQWSKTFGGTGFDKAYSVQRTSDSGYVIAGITNSSGNGEFDAWLIKTDAGGNMQWDRTFGGTNNDGVFSVQQTSDGGYILAGETWSYGAGYVNAWLIKTDASGNELLSRTFGGADFDAVFSVRQTSDGGFILAGETWSYGAGYNDAWLVKISSGAGTRTITVDDSGGADYTKIQDAIDNASDGDTILVYSGIYSENVVVNKQLILRGIDNGGGKPIVNANHRCVNGRCSAINLSAGNSILDGFIAIGSSVTWPDGGGIVVNSNNNIIINNTAWQNSGPGIFVYSFI